MPDSVPMVSAAIWTVSLMILSAGVAAKIAVAQYKANQKYDRHHANIVIFLGCLRNLKESLLYSINIDAKTEQLKQLGNTQEEIDQEHKLHAYSFEAISLQLQRFEAESHYLFPASIRKYANLAVTHLKNFAFSPDQEKQAERNKVLRLMSDVDGIIRAVSKTADSSA